MSPGFSFGHSGTPQVLFVLAVLGGLAFIGWLVCRADAEETWIHDLYFEGEVTKLRMRFSSFTPKQKEYIRTHVCDYIERKVGDDYADRGMKSLLGALKVLDAMALGHFIPQPSREEFATTLMDSKQELGDDACELAGYVWKVIPTQIAMQLLANRSNDVSPIVLLIHTPVLTDAMRACVSEGSGLRLEQIYRQSPSHVSKDDARKCLENAKSEADKVSCMILLEDRQLALELRDELKEPVQRGRLSDAILSMEESGVRS